MLSGALPFWIALKMKEEGGPSMPENRCWDQSQMKKKRKRGIEGGSEQEEGGHRLKITKDEGGLREEREGSDDRKFSTYRKTKDKNSPS